MVSASVRSTLFDNNVNKYIYFSGRKTEKNLFFDDRIQLTARDRRYIPHTTHETEP